MELRGPEGRVTNSSLGKLKLESPVIILFYVIFFKIRIVFTFFPLRTFKKIFINLCFRNSFFRHLVFSANLCSSLKWITTVSTEQCMLLIYVCVWKWGKKQIKLGRYLIHAGVIAVLRLLLSPLSLSLSHLFSLFPFFYPVLHRFFFHLHPGPPPPIFFSCALTVLFSSRLQITVTHTHPHT